MQFVKDFGALSFPATSLSVSVCAQRHPQLHHHSASLEGFEYCSTSQLKLLSSSMVLHCIKKGPFPILAMVNYESVHCKSLYYHSLFYSSHLSSAFIIEISDLMLSL